MAQDLDRFIAAQATTYDGALAELRRGRKTSHWMWFVFPQIAGLGRSDTARFYAIRDAGEAGAYRAHPVLGPRLIAATEAVIAAPGDAATILGPVDAIKLRSSMTLFAMVSDTSAPFITALDRFFDGERDEATLALLDRR